MGDLAVFPVFLLLTFVILPLIQMQNSHFTFTFFLFGNLFAFGSHLRGHPILGKVGDWYFLWNLRRYYTRAKTGFSVLDIFRKAVRLPSGHFPKTQAQEITTMSLHVTTSLNLYTENWELVTCVWDTEELLWMVAIDGGEVERTETHNFDTDEKLIEFIALRCRPTPHQEQYIRGLLMQISAQNNQIAEMFHKA